MPQRKRSRNTPILSSGLSDWVKAFLIALVLLILLRFFVIDFVSLSDSSMEKTLLPGDILVVTKYHYGARMPLRILPQSWVNLFFSTDTLPPVKQLPYWRFPANSFLDYNHLVLLNIPAPHQIPIDQRSRKIKRLVAMPGDMIHIRDGDVWVNGKQLPNPAGLQWGYTIEMRRNAEIDEFLERYQIKEGSRLKGTNRFVFPFTKGNADSISKLTEVRRIQRHVPVYDKDFQIPFGGDAKSWDHDNYGPLVLPHKGFTIRFDEQHPDRYLYHMLYHERQAVSFRNDSVFINNIYAKTYTFRNDYYFFLGDNRHNTTDSRLWGLVPENHIIGKISSVFLSLDKDAGVMDKIRWKRLFQSIDDLN